MTARSAFYTGSGMTLILGAVLAATMMLVRSRAHRHSQERHDDDCDGMLGI